MVKTECLQSGMEESSANGESEGILLKRCAARSIVYIGRFPVYPITSIEEVPSGKILTASSGNWKRDARNTSNGISTARSTSMVPSGMQRSYGLRSRATLT